MTEEQIQDSSIEPPAPLSLEEELRDYKEKYLRLLADLDNTRKRMQKERQEMTRFAVEDLINEILSPIDNLENALKFAENMSDDVRNWAQGFHMILDQFKNVLSEHGVTAFHSEGKAFDPRLHYAIETEETADFPEGTILKEYVRGYCNADRTVRAAQVKVAVAKGTKQKEGQTPIEDPSTGL